MQFFSGGFGLAPASTYCGFYYSEDGVPAAYQNVDVPLTPAGEDRWRWSDGTDNGGVTRRITGHWFSYRAWFSREPPPAEKAVDNGEKCDRIIQLSEKRRDEAKRMPVRRARRGRWKPSAVRLRKPLHQPPGTTGTPHPRYRMA